MLLIQERLFTICKICLLKIGANSRQVFPFTLIFPYSFRYGCVHAQYMEPGVSRYDTDEYYWMVTKCKNLTLNDISTNLCKNPGQDGKVDSITPVNALSSGENYRNKYCAVCNGVPIEANLVSWKLQVSNTDYLSFPDKHLLITIRKQNGNIIFIPPSYVYAERCILPAYTITTCNETGLWEDYNVTIDIACHAFVDTFNFTYQNYFCYLCNSPAQLMPTTDWKCSLDASFIATKTPPLFKALLEVESATADDKEKHLECGLTQIGDYKNVSAPCREKNSFQSSV